MSYNKDVNELRIKYLIRRIEQRLKEISKVNKILTLSIFKYRVKERLIVKTNVDLNCEKFISKVNRSTNEELYSYDIASLLLDIAFQLKALPINEIIKLRENISDERSECKSKN